MDIVVKFLFLIVVVETGLLVALHVFYNYHIHKLLNKLMSRDFRDYNTVAKPKERLEVKLDTDIPEDLRVLQGFQIP